VPIQGAYAYVESVSSRLFAEGEFAQVVRRLLVSHLRERAINGLLDDRFEFGKVEMDTRHGPSP